MLEGRGPAAEGLVVVNHRSAVDLCGLPLQRVDAHPLGHRCVPEHGRVDLPLGSAEGLVDFMTCPTVWFPLSLAS